MSKKIKSKYRSENSIYRIFTGYMQTKKNQPQRHFQTKYTYNQCQRRKYRCLDRHIQLDKIVVENKIGVKWSFRVCLLAVRTTIHLANLYFKPQSLIHLSWRTFLNFSIFCSPRPLSPLATYKCTGDTTTMCKKCDSTVLLLLSSVSQTCD